MFAFLGPLVADIVGKHLFANLAGGSFSVILALIHGLGLRFLLGLLASLYFTNDSVHAAINAVGAAVVKVVL